MIDIIKTAIKTENDTGRYIAEPKVVLFDAVYKLLQDSNYKVNEENTTINEYYDETYHYDKVGGLWRIFEEKYGYEIMKFIEEKANELTEYMVKE